MTVFSRSKEFTSSEETEVCESLPREMKLSNTIIHDPKYI